MPHPELNSTKSDMKSTLHTCKQFLGLRVTHFHQFPSTISRFQYIAHFRMFPLTRMLKCHII